MKFPSFAIFSLGLIILSQGVNVQADEKQSRPNLILLLADDLGWTGLGCFGSDLYETPNLDALAASGVKFTNAYSACTVCSPTRASIMTGLYPARLRLTDFIAGQNRPFAKLRIPDWNKRLAPEQTTIAEVLRQAGYRTGHIGKWHLNGRGTDAAGTMPTDQGFDYSFERPQGTKGYTLRSGSESEQGSNFLTDALTDKACDFIEQSQSEPFFLYFAYNVPHTPIQGRRDLVEYFEQRVDPNAIHTNATYAAMVASLDQSAGRIFAKLDECGLSDNTFILFFSDNGGLTQRYGKHDRFTENLPLRRGKGSAYEGGVRVPALAYWPGVTTAASICDKPIMTIDIFPTLLDVARVARSPAATVDGQSLVPLLHDVSRNIERDLYWHYPHYHAGGDSPYRAIRSGNFKLIEFHEDSSLRLYDLANDIGEKNDLSAMMPQKTEEFRNKLHQWLESVKAQMPTVNPAYDPKRKTQVSKGVN